MYPYEPSAYVLIVLAAVIVAYIATERIDIDSNIIRFSRYLITLRQAPINDVYLTEDRIGILPFVRGFIIRRRSNDEVVAQIVANNYTSRDIDRLKEALIPGTQRSGTQR